MKSVIVCLNAVIDTGMQCEINKNHARLALHAIESQQLAVNALRLIVANKGSPKNPALVESLDHAERLLDLHDKLVAKYATPAEVVHLDSPNSAGLAAAKNTEADQDVSDLV